MMFLKLLPINYTNARYARIGFITLIARFIKIKTDFW